MLTPDLQVDDLFLATEEPFVTTNSYRMTAADSQSLAAFAANVPALPAGSNFRVRLTGSGCPLACFPLLPFAAFGEISMQVACCCSLLGRD
jgi:hypothetical protein